MRSSLLVVSLLVSGVFAGAAFGQGGVSTRSGAGSVSAVVEFADLRGVALDDVPVGATVRVTGVALQPPVGVRGAAREASLSLERFSVLGSSAVVFTEGPEGRTPVDTSAILLLGGSVDGEPGSVAFIGFSDAGVFGYVRAAEGMYAISSGPYDPAAAGEVTIAHTSALPEPLNDAPPCGYDPRDPRLNPAGAMIDAVRAPSGSSSRMPVCRSVDIAIDTDWEYTNRLFGSNAGISAQYAVVLLGAVGQIYKSELNVRLTTNYVRTWTSNSDPYHLGGNLLDEFAAHWSSNMGSVPRELAHLLSGDYGGGVAYLSAICEGWGYGLSGVNGSFPSPLVNRHGGNWDLMVVAHELGHNFGTGHTHDSYEPVIDGCGNGDCSAALGGTIMSYCHTCPGGMTNIDLLFGSRVQDRIWSYLDTRTCVLPSQGEQVAVADSTTAIQGGVVDVYVLNNDSDVSCTAPAIASFDATSALGGSVALISSTPGPTQHMTRKFLRYTAPASASGVDTFTYTLTSGSTATVTANVVAARAAENPASTAPGVDTRYFVVPALSSLPNFALLPSYIRERVGQINFPSTTGVFATSGRSDNVGAVFQGLVSVPVTGLYTISLASDDGSKLYLGDSLLIDHDGLHGISTRTADVGLAAGTHRVRVEYFERTGSAGLVVSLSGPGVANQPIPAAMWSSYCPSDVDRNGEIDIVDFLTFIDAFGTCDGSSGACNVGGVRADFDGNGVIDVVDLLDYLDAFGGGC